MFGNARGWVSDWLGYTQPFVRFITLVAGTAQDILSENKNRIAVAFSTPSANTFVNPLTTCTNTNGLNVSNVGSLMFDAEWYADVVGNRWSAFNGGGGTLTAIEVVQIHEFPVQTTTAESVDVAQARLNRLGGAGRWKRSAQNGSQRTISARSIEPFKQSCRITPDMLQPLPGYAWRCDNGVWRMSR